MNLAGGLGLILLGMKLMTDGLKLAAGSALRRVLASSTKTPLRGLASGFMMTSAVQSSSAVTVAAIGFINAGVMTLAQTVWVIYGSNVGTTTTAWIVALVGLKINIKVLALPLIAVGTGLWLSQSATRRAALGEALAGFGLFFLGIEILQGAFGGLGETLRPEDWAMGGIAGRMALAGVGFVLTFLMQSSSAAMALILTATAGGMIPMEQAAAAVIGANVGTTSTAAIAVIGATANARRAAALHVIFNLVTGIAAFLGLPLILGGILHMRLAWGLSLDPVPVLALFHSIFNVLGVVLVGPFTGRMVDMVQNWFGGDEEGAPHMKYLDDTVLSTPSMATGALAQEVARVGRASLRMAYAALRCGNIQEPCRELHREKALLDKLQAEIGEFSAKLSKQGLAREASMLIPGILRSLRYFVVSGDMALEAETAAKALPNPSSEALKTAHEGLQEAAIALSLHADSSDKDFNSTLLDRKSWEFEQAYQAYKELLLDAGSNAEIPIETMVDTLDYLSHLHRMIDQMVKGAALLHEVGTQLGVYGRKNKAA